MRTPTNRHATDLVHSTISIVPLHASAKRYSCEYRPVSFHGGLDGKRKSCLDKFPLKVLPVEQMDVVRDTLVMRPHYKNPSGGTASQKIELAS